MKENVDMNKVMNETEGKKTKKKSLSEEKCDKERNIIKMEIDKKKNRSQSKHRFGKRVNKKK